MTSLTIFPWSIALLAVVVAATTDLWRFKIPNWLTLPLLVLGLLYHASVGGTAAFMASGLGVLAGFLLLPMYLGGGMGAGDVKLLAGLGAWIHVQATLEILVLSCLLAGGYSVMLLLCTQRRLAANAQNSVLGEGVERLVGLADHRSRLIPFGAMVAGGMIISRAINQWL